MFPNLSFARPMGLFQAPGDDSRWYVVEQEGSIRSFANDPNVATVTELIADPLGAELGATEEGGLLGFAFHPSYATNGAAFLAYTVRVAGNPGLTQRIARYKRNAGGTLSKDADIFERPAPASSVREEHNLGALAFGADGLLYVALGDGYVLGTDPANPAQNPFSVFGKILRIDVGPSGPYTVPDGNPYKLGGGAPEVYALGLRNPWRFSFDRHKPNDLWVGDVGDDTWEEINKVELGKNYGWSVMGGAHCYAAPTCDATGREPPLVEYAHTSGLLAVIGGYVYRGKQYPSLYGTYLYGDFSGRIWALPNGVPPAEVQLDVGFPITSFAEDNDGELYVLAYEGQNSPAKIFKIVGVPPGEPSTFPKRLSATGCVDPGAPSKPAPGVIPFDLNSPLWSDGAEKRRWLALPAGTQVHIREDGDLEFPIGSVLMKEFRLQGNPVETRLLVRHSDGDWGGYSYEWSDDGSDALLLDGEKTKSVGGQSWVFPSRGQCLYCHTVEAGRSLGPELQQLNRDFTYEETGRTANQLVTLEHLGLLDRPIGDPATLPRLPDPFGDAPVDARARAYLHANCSFCHRPGGPGRGQHNLLFSADLRAMNVCDVAPGEGDLGLTDPRLLAPGDPSRSILSARMKALGGTRMPPLATSRVHEDAAKLVDDWIRTVTACP
jgi:uncharacterized repeat protein (TIGR03806 family)